MPNYLEMSRRRKQTVQSTPDSMDGSPALTAQIVPVGTRRMPSSRPGPVVQDRQTDVERVAEEVLHKISRRLNHFGGGTVGLNLPDSATFRNLTVTGNTVLGDASGDTLTIHPSAVTWQNNPTHSGNHIFSGNLSVGGNITLGSDAVLVRDAANVLAQRNGTSAQALYVYNTFTDASNYERGGMQWSAGALRIGTQAAGTGSGRDLTLMVNGANVWRVLSAGGHFLSNTDNITDIGASGANRPRTGYFGTSLLSPFIRVDNTATGAAVADSVQLYSSDDAAGHTIPSFYCEGSNVLATGQADSASSVRVKMRINGTVVTLLAI
jgi:hypothetical protein